jgi:hypothetical protein
MSAHDINNILTNSSSDSPSPLITIELKNFLELNLPPRELLLHPWLPKSGLCMVHAFRGIGKTHMSLGIAYAVAKGGDFLGWKAPKARNVLYIDGEMPAAILQERLARIVLMSGDSSLSGKLRIITPDLQIGCLMPDLATLEGQQSINRQITDETDLIIIDNLSCLAPSIKENDASDWALIQTWVLNLRAQGKSVLLIHHSGKSGGQRGTSKKEDVLDTVIALERPKDYDSSQGARFIVKFEKSRGFCGDDSKSFEAQLVNENEQFSWKIQSIEDSTYHKVISLYNDGATQTDISIDLSINKSNVSRHIKRARAEGLIQGQGGNHD